jgi:hypothetical protein
MANSNYIINKGINKSMEFRGLKAQYIWYFGAMVIVLLVLFAAMYIAGANTYFCIALVGVGGTFGTMRLYSLSQQYGEHGMMKAIAKKRVPAQIKSYSRKIFQQLDSKPDDRKLKKSRNSL